MHAPTRLIYHFTDAQPPTLDGEIGKDEWPDRLLRLDRAPSRWRAAGAPVFAKLAYDDLCLYVAVNVPMFDTTQLGKGAQWGQRSSWGDRGGGDVGRCFACSEGGRNQGGRAAGR